MELKGHEGYWSRQELFPRISRHGVTDHQTLAGLLTITLLLAAVVWVVGGAVLFVILQQQSRIQADAQHISSSWWKASLLWMQI